MKNSRTGANWCTLAAILCLSPPALHAQQSDEEIAALARETIVHISVEFISEDGGPCAISTQGTGFIVSKDGHVITASHIFLPPDGCGAIAEKGINGNLGGFGGQFPTPMRVAAAPDFFADVVLLKLDEQKNDYPVASVCRSSDLTSGQRLLAFGFPVDTGFAPIVTTYSNPDGGGKDRWVVSSNFTHGMSGGPVYDQNGDVVAFIQGGLKNTPAVRYIVPLRQARSHIEIGSELPECTEPTETCNSRNLNLEEYIKCEQ